MKYKLFTATWCTNCTPVKKKIEEKDLKVQMLDLDQFPQDARRYGIRGLPTLVIEEGDEVELVVGAEKILAVLEESNEKA